MHLPQPNLHIKRLGLRDEVWIALDGHPLPRDSSEPPSESKRSVKGDSGQTTSIYRPRASLT
jgi:hypothetical protein